MQTASNQSVAALNAMRLRAQGATAQFYSMIGRPAPKPRPRFYAESKGRMWHIIDSNSGKTCAFSASHENAMKVLDGLEADAAGRRGL